MQSYKSLASSVIQNEEAYTKKAEKIGGTKQAAVYLKGIQKKIYEAAEAIAS